MAQWNIGKSVAGYKSVRVKGLFRLDIYDFVSSFPTAWRPFAVEGGGSERDPLVFARVPRGPHRSPLAPQPKAYSPADAGADSLVTVSASGALGVHGWSPSGAPSSSSPGFSFDKDSSKTARQDKIDFATVGANLIWYAWVLPLNVTYAELLSSGSFLS